MIKKLSLSIVLIIIFLIPVLYNSCQEANFEVSDLKITPGSAMAGEIIEVSVTVFNTGSSEGMYNLVLKIDGKQAENELIALAGGAEKSVTLSVTLTKPGEHQVEMAGLLGTITVVDLDQIMANALEVISEIDSYHFTCILEIEVAIPEDFSLFEELEGFEELP